MSVSDVTPRNIVLLESLIIDQLVSNFPPFMGPRSLLLLP
jgi:hypothetical protein